MPELREKIIEILCQYNELSVVKLIEKTDIGNRNKAFEIINQLEKDGHVKTRKQGRERLVSLSSPNKTVDSFINSFGKRLDSYDKIINKHLIGLEKNLPLVSTIHPLKKVKTKTGVLELDKKRGVYRDMGKTQDSHAYTWKTRPKPLIHFNTLLNTLYKLYQESSVINFAEPITDDPKLIKKYQKRSDMLIRDTIRKIENMFKENDMNSFHYVITQLRNTLYGLIFRVTLEKEIKSE